MVGPSNLWSLDPADDRPNFWDRDGAVLATQAYQFIQVGVGYELANIGHARLQYVGGFTGTDPQPTSKKDASKNYVPYDLSRPARFEAAFAYTGFENLLVDFGVRPYLPLRTEKDKDSVWHGVDLSLGATFDFSGLGISGLAVAARADSNLLSYQRKGDYDQQANGASIVTRLVPSYDLGFAIVGIDFGFFAQGNSIDRNGYSGDDSIMQLGVGVWIMKEVFGGGLIKMGIANSFAPMYGKERQVNGSNVLSIPVILSYSL